MKKIVLFLSVVFLLLTIFLAINNYIRTKKIRGCENSGGRWVETGPILSNGQASLKYCYHPPSDEGKKCYENSECLIDCISTSETDEKGYILGKCGEYSINDCIPEIPKKTKSRNELRSGACS